jgi:hypothetical protein
MPHFFFHVINGNGETPDEEGLDLESASAARRIALESIRSIVAEEARRGAIDLHGHILVKDAADNDLMTVEFIEAFELRMPDRQSAA